MKASKRPKSSAARDSETLKRLFFLAVLVGVMVLVFLVARPFLGALLLAALSAGVFYPVHRWIGRRLGKGRSLAPMISTALFCLIILAPAGALGYFTVAGLIDIAETVAGNNREIGNWLRELESSIRALPLFSRGRLAELISPDRLSSGLENAASWMLRQASGVVENVVRLLLLLFVYLYSLFFFIRDGDRILRAVGDTVPLPEADKLAVGRKFLSVTRAILKSTFIIGGLQGLVGGLLYWAVGVQGPVFWGILILVIAAIPGVGPIVVWLPTAVVFAILGEYVKGAVILGVGAAVIPLAELLRPALVGGEARVHPVLVLVGVLGGLALFGIAGLLFGPLIMGALVALWEIFRRMFGRELNRM